jgi:hypothetical protein
MSERSGNKVGRIHALYSFVAWMKENKRGLCIVTAYTERLLKSRERLGVVPHPAIKKSYFMPDN